MVLRTQVISQMHRCSSFWNSDYDPGDVEARHWMILRDALIPFERSISSHEQSNGIARLQLPPLNRGYQDVRNFTIIPDIVADINRERSNIRAAASSSWNMSQVGPLLDLYQATNGLEWTPPVNISSSPCSWSGITCSASGDVTTIIFNTRNLVGTLPSSLSRLPYLNTLNLFTNPGLSGTIPTELALLPKLQYLQVDTASFSGTLPTELGNMTSLIYLRITRCPGISGTIPTQLCRVGSPLTYTGLYRNTLSGTIPTQYAQCIKLTTIDVENNMKLRGTIPTELGLMPSLTTLYMRNNSLSGQIPRELGNATKLQRLYLGNNYFCGTLPSELFSKPLTVLWVSQNRLRGTIPTEIGNTLLYFLIVANNQLEGQLPSQIGRVKSINALYLDNNRFTGTIPPEFMLINQLTGMTMSSNMLTGTIPPAFPNVTLSSLDQYDLSNNQLSGTLPTAGWESLPVLREFKVGGNNLRGTIPETLGSCSKLQSVILSKNKLVGVVPRSFRLLPVLQRLDISDNDLGTDLGTCLLPVLQRFASAYCGLQLAIAGPNGTVTSQTTDCIQLTMLGAARCKLRGPIPSSLNALFRTSVVDLSGNPGLFGSFPATDGSLTIVNPLTAAPTTWSVELPEWTILDLSGCTNISGQIPPSMSQLLRLSVVNFTGTSIRFPNDTLPPYLQRNQQSITYIRTESTRPVQCPTISFNTMGADLDIDPSSYEWKGCGCLHGDVGRDGHCWGCPYGAVCEGDAIQVRRGFWCGSPPQSNDSALIQCFLCTPGSCCSAPTCFMELQCAYNRKGFMCSECEDGTSVGITNTVCVSPNQCQAYKWAIPLAIILGSIYPIFLVRSWDLSSLEAQTRPLKFVMKYAFTTIIYYYQIVPMLISPISRLGMAQLLSAILGFVNLQPDATSNSSNRSSNADGPASWCLMPGMTAVSNDLLSLVIPADLLMWNGTLALGAYIMIKRQRSQKNKHEHLQMDHVNSESKWTIRHWIRVPKHGYAGHSAALFTLLQILYAVVLKALFKLLLCSEISNGYLILLISPNIQCFQAWQYALMLGLLPLIALPALVVLYARRCYNIRTSGKELTSFEMGAFSVMCLPYRDRYWYWGGVVLFRRLVLVALYSFTTEVVLRAWLLAVGCLVFFAVNIKHQPHKYKRIGTIDDGLQFALAILSLGNLVESVFHSQGLDVLDPTEFLGGLATALIFSPVPLIGIWLVVISRQSAQRNRIQNDSCANDGGVMEETEHHLHHHLHSNWNGQEHATQDHQLFPKTELISGELHFSSLEFC